MVRGESVKIQTPVFVPKIFFARHSCSEIIRRLGTRATHAYESPETSPETVVGELAPASRMGHCSVVKYSTKQVDENGDNQDETEY